MINDDQTNVFKRADAKLLPTPTTVYFFPDCETVLLPLLSRLCHKMTKKCQNCDSDVKSVKMQRNSFYASWFLSTTWKACELTNQSICSSINQLVNCCAAARLRKRHRASELFCLHPSTDCHETARLRHGHQTMSTAIRIGH